MFQGNQKVIKGNQNKSQKTIDFTAFSALCHGVRFPYELLFFKRIANFWKTLKMPDTGFIAFFIIYFILAASDWEI